MFCNRFWVENAWEMHNQNSTQAYSATVQEQLVSVAMTFALHLPRFPRSTMLPVTILEGWVMSLNRQQSSTDTRTGDCRPDISIDVSGTLTDHPSRVLFTRNTPH